MVRRHGGVQLATAAHGDGKSRQASIPAAACCRDDGLTAPSRRKAGGARAAVTAHPASGDRHAAWGRLADTVGATRPDTQTRFTGGRMEHPAAGLVNAAADGPGLGDTDASHERNVVSTGEIVFTPARTLAHQIRKREISAREVMIAHVEQIERVNPTVNAIVAMIGAEQAIERANEADRNPGDGPLHGLPTAFKDLEDAVGFPNTQGSPIFRDRF